MTDTRTRLSLHQSQSTDAMFPDLYEQITSLWLNTKHIKQSVPTAAALPETGNTHGDERTVLDENRKYRWDEPTAQWKLIDGGGMEDTIFLQQATKLSVVASPASPKIYEFNIPPTYDFKRLPVEVLKFVPGPADQVTTISDFNNGDASSFIADEQVIFDGKMYLRTTYDYPMVDEGGMGTGRMFSYEIDRSRFKAIEKLEVY
jgi:hypothetical protein